jgi:putative DNA primase/helicase
VPDLRAIARHYGGKVVGNECLIPTPGHSPRDRGTAIRIAPGAPDGLLVTCFNGGQSDALNVKDMLRADGFLPPRNGPARPITASERRALQTAQLARTQERENAQRTTAMVARGIWNSGKQADPAHPYLVRKGFPPFGIRQTGGTLLVPMIDASFALWNLQRVRADGTKLFLSGGRTKGLFWPHGAHMADGSASDGPLVIGEGYSTMAAIHAATGLGVIAAMTARNLETVAIAMRRMFPRRAIVIAADDDSHLKDNLGMIEAIKAGRAIGGPVATPRAHTCPGEPGADFGDIAPDAVAVRISAALQGE